MFRFTVKLERNDASGESLSVFSNIAPTEVSQKIDDIALFTISVFTLLFLNIQ